MDSLPPETMVEILSYLDWNNLLYASHICARLRAIALESPLLWAHVSLPTLAAARDYEVILARSSQCALTITIDVHLWQHQDVMSYFLAMDVNWTRLRGLCITFGPRSWHDLLEWIASQHAPILSELSLHFRDPEGGNGSLFLPKEFAADDWAPNLRSLTLVNLYLPQDTNTARCSGLSTVTRFTQRFTISSSIDHDDMQAMILSFPHLQSATLEGPLSLYSFGVPGVLQLNPEFWSHVELTLIETESEVSVYPWLATTALRNITIHGADGDALAEFMPLCAPVALFVHLRDQRLAIVWENEGGQQYRFEDIQVQYADTVGDNGELTKINRPHPENFDDEEALNFLKTCYRNDAFANITRLELCWPTSYIPEVLVLMPNLARLAIVLVADSFDETPISESYELPNLQSLTLIRAPEPNSARVWLRTDAEAILKFTDALFRPSAPQFDELVLSFVKFKDPVKAAARLAERFRNVELREIDSPVFGLS